MARQLFYDPFAGKDPKSFFKVPVQFYDSGKQMFADQFQQFAKARPYKGAQPGDNRIEIPKFPGMRTPIMIPNPNFNGGKGKPAPPKIIVKGMHRLPAVGKVHLTAPGEQSTVNRAGVLGYHKEDWLALTPDQKVFAYAQHLIMTDQRGHPFAFKPIRSPDWMALLIKTVNYVQSNKTQREVGIIMNGLGEFMIQGLEKINAFLPDMYRFIQNTVASNDPSAIIIDQRGDPIAGLKAFNAWSDALLGYKHN